MKIIIIGAVAAGTSAAAKARRNNEDAEIIIYEKDSFISYSGCGMPYYIGGIINSAEELYPRDPLFFKTKYNVDIKILHEVLSVHPDTNSVDVKDLTTDVVFTDYYDKLVIAAGASAVVPPIKGTGNPNVFKLRNIKDMLNIKSYINEASPKKAIIIGTGFIGLEVCENLKALGIKVVMIERLPQTSPGFDSDMAVYIKEHLEKNGAEIHLNAYVSEITDSGVILADGRKIPGDFILISAGIKPETRIAAAAGIELGITGAIKVNRKMQTNIPNIYACGDCAEQYNLITGKAIYRPLGSTANKTGRITGDSITGGNLEFRGILGTAIFKIFGLTAALTGLTEREASELGYDIEVCHNIKPDKPEYMNGKEMIIKGIADRKDGKMLGVQIIGYEGVDKRIDVFATAITFKAKAEDLFHLDLAYAPPFSTTKDPVMYTGMILDNAISGGRPLITPDGLESLINSGVKYNLIDTRTTEQFGKGHIETAKSIEHADIRKESDMPDRDAVTVTYCNKGVTGNAVQNILLNKGYKKVYNLSGGYRQFKASHPK